MKKMSFLILIAGLILGLSSCSDQIEETYTVNTPEYLSYEDLRSSFTVKSAEAIHQPGKFYFKDDFIFINEYQKGIHIVDNADPKNPQIVSFIEIPGNVDMAIKGDKLYADSYIDLLTIDVSDLNNINEVDRDTNVFPYIIPEFEVGVLGRIDQNKGVVTGYNVTQKTENVSDNMRHYQRFPRWEAELFAMDGASANKISNTGTGQGGSMARFTVFDDFLYAIDKASLNLFDLSNAANPEFTKRIPVSWEIETLFPYNQMLFIGARSGMFIYSLQNPANPEFISEFRHASACDPVVVEGDFAYVTLRGGNLCGAIESQLDVIDISIIEYPELLKTYPMTEPYGLGVENEVLFVCDGKAGLKIYHAGDPYAIDENMIAHYEDIDAFDVIPLGDVLLVIGADGLYQYDYTSLEDITQLSYIPVFEN
ncbi:MAG: LVIVD repeat-containing protein [Bacteroidota bacterium]